MDILEIRTHEAAFQLTLEEQIEKIKEELEEVIKSDNAENTLEELCDIIQSCHTAIKIMEKLANRYLLREAWNKHCLKLKMRGVLVDG